MLPKQARGTLRKNITKPTEQVAAPPSIVVSQGLIGTEDDSFLHSVAISRLASAELAKIQHQKSTSPGVTVTNGGGNKETLDHEMLRFLPLLPPYLQLRAGALPPNWEDCPVDPAIPDVSNWEPKAVTDYFTEQGFLAEHAAVFLKEVSRYFKLGGAGDRFCEYLCVHCDNLPGVSEGTRLTNTKFTRLISKISKSSQYAWITNPLSNNALFICFQEIDGSSLLLLHRQDVIGGLGLKMGPALKVFDQVRKLQTRRNLPTPIYA